MADAPAKFHFHNDAVGDDTFTLYSLLGREEMSTPYRFEMELLTRKKPESIKLEDLIAKPSHLAIRHSVALREGGPGSKVFKIHGILSEFELVDKVQDYVRYRAVLVPRLWKLSLTSQSRIFQDTDILKVIKGVLTDPKTHKFSSEDYELKTSATYPQQEFIVQYNESDLDFLHRWLEHYGIFYFFVQSDKGEKVVFCDAAAAYLPSLGNVRYRPSEESVAPGAAPGMDTSRTEETIKALRYRMSKLPTSVVLKDYNYRNPSVENKAQADVKDAKGEGKVYEYGDHFKSPSEGKAIAQVRAEEITAREKSYEGRSDVRPLRPGLVFTLDEHFHSGLNRDYVITSIVHKMERSRSSDGGVSDAIGYHNEFKSIESDVVFRPERKTAWPSIHGFMNATIDAGGDGKYAEIDNTGRYKVKLPFDLSDKKDGKASQYVRMAQPYSGAGMGMHFPLHKGTEVVVSFLDGDPDRPIIAGSIPNPESASPVTGGNQTQSVIHTGGGNKIVLEDTDGSQQIRMSSPTQSTYISLGAKNDPGHLHTGTAGDAAHDVGGSSTTNIAGNEAHHTEGTTFWEHKGFTSEKYLGSKQELVVGSNTAQTIGAYSETITGIKHETVLGMILEIGMAVKIEKVAGPHLFEDPVLKQEAKAFYMVEAPAGLIDIKDLMIDSSQVILIKSGGSKHIMNPSGSVIKAPAVACESDGVNVLKGATVVVKAKNEAGINAGGDLEVEGGTLLLKSKGALNQKGAEIHAEADTFEVNGSTLEVTKSKVSAKGTTFSVE
jgi:type VI secretion system secreted protein VgrG